MLYFDICIQDNLTNKCRSCHCCTLQIWMEKNHLWGWQPPFWYAVFRGCLGGTQYAKGRYAVRKNPVISYADINFRSSFHQETQETWYTKSNISIFSRARFTHAVWGHLSKIINLNINFGRSKLGKITRKHIKANFYRMIVRTCACNRLSFYLLYVNGNAQNGCFRC